MTLTPDEIRATLDGATTSSDNYWPPEVVRSLARDLLAAHDTNNSLELKIAERDATIARLTVERDAPYTLTDLHPTADELRAWANKTCDIQDRADMLAYANKLDAANGGKDE